MRFKEFKIINEAKGLFGRNTGDVFIDSAGTKYEFQQITEFPDLAASGSSQFEDPESRDNEVFNVTQELLGDVFWVNKPTKSYLAFAIAELHDPKGNSIYWGRYFKEIKGSMLATWANKETQPGFKLQVAGAQKLQAKLAPQDLINSEKEFQNVAEIFNTVKNNAEDQHKDILVTALTKLAAGSSEVEFPDMWDQQTALRDYFSEIMQPMALMGGVIKGAAEEARIDLADGASWSDCAVSWPMAANEPLIDSVLIAPNGQRIGVSTKGGKGADASIKNVHDAYLKAEKEGNKELIQSSAYTIEILKIIANYSGVRGPVELGRFLKIKGMTNKLQAEIEEFIKSGKEDLNGVSPTGVKLIELANSAVGYKTGFSMLTGVAKIVAAKINSSSEFSRGALALLNQSSIVQIYTTMKKSGNNAVLASFNAVYPPTFDGHVILNGAKAYMGTRNNGKFAFGFGTAAQLAKAGAVPTPTAVKTKAVKPAKNKLSAASGGTKAPKEKGTTKRSKR